MVLSLLSLVCTSFILGAVNHTEPPILTIERREERKGERGRGEEEGGREGGRRREGEGDGGGRMEGRKGERGEEMEEGGGREREREGGREERNFNHVVVGLFFVQTQFDHLDRQHIVDTN